MKYEELQYERLGDANKTYPASTLVIRKQFVDAAIAELKDDNRRLKRALWLARAWGANQRTKYLDFFLTGRAHAIRKYKWIKITSNCRAKAEEYK